MTFNTGNPVGSTDARDLYDNAQNFDKFSLGQDLEYPDRLGVPRKSLAGIRAEVTEALSRLGYQVIGEYTAGLVVQNYGQVFRKDGEFYRAKAELTLPYLLNGDWAVDAPKFVSVGDAVLRQELAELSGAELVGWARSPLAEGISSINTVGLALSSQAITPWEFFSLIVDKPNANDPSTWDWYPAIQAAVDSGQSVMFPAGSYYSSQTIRTAHTGSYFRADTGQVIFGAGTKTRLTRNSTSPASTAEAAYESEAFFSVHGSNFEISSLYFEDCAIGIYFGQDPRQAAENSHTSFNRMRNLWMKNCGTGILSACAQGHYYNTYADLHIAQCQVGVKFQAGTRWASSVDNNNRNTFINVRAARCWVGMWLENGDTNDFFGFHCEGNNATPANNRYTIPSGLPGSVANYGGVTLPAITTAGAFLVKGGNNNFFGCITESCDWTLWNQGPNNSYQNCLFGEDVPNTTAVRCVVAPRNFVSRYTAWLNGGDIARLPNTNSYAFPGVPAGRLITSALRGVRAIATRELSVASGSTDPVREFLLDLGAIQSGGSVSFPLWVDSSDERGCSCGFEIAIEGNNQSGSTMHSTRIGGVAGRNSSGTLTRYYAAQISNFRATGTGAGDTAEPFVAALSVSGSDLRVTLTAPARAFSSVKVFVRLVMSKA